MRQEIPLSVVIPNYNGSKVIADVLHSLAQQVYDATLLEIIVVDDASSDCSVDIIENDFPDVVLLKNQKRSGPSFSKNRGIARAQHSHVLFLDSDIMLVENTVSQLVDYAVNSTAVCFQPKILFYDQSGMLNSTGGVANVFGYAWDRGIFENDSTQYDSQKRILFATSAAMLIRKDVFKSIGMFDADYFYLNEDYDVGYRLALCGMGVEYVPSATCYHHMSYTMGRDNPQVKYLIERNRMATIIKNYEWKTLCSIMPRLLKVKRAKFATIYLEKEEGRAVFVWAAIKSVLWILVHMPILIAKRIKIQSFRRVSDRAIFDMFKEYEFYFPKFSKAKAA